MVLSVATIRITKNACLRLRIFVNRKHILQDASKSSSLEVPLLSNNSIVSLKSPMTGIYLSDSDMKPLCNEIKQEILLILYELASPTVTEKILAKIRIGQTIDFQTGVVEKIRKMLRPDDNTDTSFVTSNVQTITRVSRFKFKLHYVKNWELHIFIDNIKKLSKIREYLLYWDKWYMHGNRPIMELNQHKNSLLLAEKVSVFPQVPTLLGSPRSSDTEINGSGSSNENVPNDIDGDDDSHSGNDHELGIVEDVKPEIKYKYRSLACFGSCIDIHVLQRPRRHKIPSTTQS